MQNGQDKSKCTKVENYYSMIKILIKVSFVHPSNQITTTIIYKENTDKINFFSATSVCWQCNVRPVSSQSGVLEGDPGGPQLNAS